MMCMRMQLPSPSDVVQASLRPEHSSRAHLQVQHVAVADRPSISNGASSNGSGRSVMIIGVPLGH